MKNCYTKNETFLWVGNRVARSYLVPVGGLQRALWDDVLHMFYAHSRMMMSYWGQCTGKLLF